MRKLNVFLVAAIAVMMLSFVIADSSSEDLQNFVKKVAEKKGILQEDITNISKLDFNDLPKEISLKEIADSNVALYKIESKFSNPSFVITFSESGFQKTLTKTDYVTSLLNFGLGKHEKGPEFLETSSGVKTSLENGYVMLREGSITGISTSLNVLKSSEGENIEIVIYRNGEEVGFRNSIPAGSEGVKKDYDTQSYGIVNFNPGEVISVYARTGSDVSFENVITNIETSSKN